MRLRSAQFLPKLGFLFFYTSLVVSPLSAARIISLLPSNTEILEALGAGGEVVGITRFDRPAPGREVVGDFFQPNVEKIVSLKPDLILSGLWASSRTGSSLGKMGYAIVEIRNPRSIEEIYESIRSIARTVYRQREAEEVIRDMKSRLAHLAARAHQLPRRLRTYIEIDAPFWTIGGHDYLSEITALAGADNIFSDLERPSAQVSPEVIVERDPELIITFDLKKKEIARRPGWAAVSAVRHGYVLDDLNRDALSRPSPRIVEGAEEFERRIEDLLRK